MICFLYAFEPKTKSSSFRIILIHIVANTEHLSKETLEETITFQMSEELNELINVIKVTSIDIRKFMLKLDSIKNLGIVRDVDDSQEILISEGPFI